MADKERTVKGQTQRPQDNDKWDKNYSNIDFSALRDKPSYIKKKDKKDDR